MRYSFADLENEGFQIQNVLDHSSLGYQGNVLGDYDTGPSNLWFQVGSVKTSPYPLLRLRAQVSATSLTEGAWRSSDS